MNVADVFHIRGRGTVLTGKLEGQGQLDVGDYAVCEAGTWQVTKLEMLGSTLETASPGQNVGVLLGSGPPGDLLRNLTVYFQPDARGPMGPQLTAIPQKRKRWGR